MRKIALAGILLVLGAPAIASAADDCPNCTATTESCVEAVCGKNAGKLRQQIVDEAVREANGPAAKDALRAMAQEIEAVIDSRVKEHLLELSNLEAVLENPPIKIDPKMRVMHNLQFYSDHLDSLTIKYVVKGESELSVHVDEEATEKKLTERGMAPGDRKWFINVARTSYRTPMSLRATRAQVLFANAEAFLRSEHPQVPLEEAVRTEIRQMKKDLSESLKKGMFSPFFRAYLETVMSELRTLEGKVEYVPEDMEDVLLYYSVIGAFNRIYSDGEAIFREREPTPPADVAAKHGLLAKVKAFRKALADPGRLAPIKAKVRETCMANASLLWASAPDDKVKSDEVMTEAKRRIRGAVFPLFSEKSVAGLDGMLRKVFFAAPQSKKGAIEGVVRRLKEGRDSNALVAEIYGKLDSADLAQVTLLEFYTLRDWKDEEGVLVDMLETCEKFRVSTQLTDLTLTTSGNVVPSWSSLKRPEYGVGITAHELGHLIFRKMSDASISAESRKKFDEALDCLELSHPSSPARHYADDDFADLVADLSMPKGGTAWSCLLLESAHPSPYELINKNPSDPHSAPVLRVMRTYQRMKGMLPNACLPAGGTSSLLTVAPSSCL